MTPALTRTRPSKLTPQTLIAHLARPPVEAQHFVLLAFLRPVSEFYLQFVFELPVLVFRRPHVARDELGDDEIRQLLDELQGVVARLFEQRQPGQRRGASRRLIRFRRLNDFRRLTPWRLRP